MKSLLSILLVCFCMTKTFSQNDSLKAKFSGNCLISGGTISLSDYKNLKIICPPKLTKVIHFKRIHQPKGTQRKNGYPTYFEGNVESLTIFPDVKSGDIVVIDEIIGLGPDKKRATSEGMVLIIK